MMNQFSRTESIIGPEAMSKLRNSRVAVFGLGGVGGYAVEALVRSGLGAIDIIDSDKVDISNLNRQIIATHDTVSRYKVDVLKERILSINPEIAVSAHRVFYLPEKADLFDFSLYDYVVDAIDTVTAKIDLAVRCQDTGTPVISCMGCGNRLDPTMLKVTDIHKTVMDPLARVMRHELKKRQVEKLKVVYSTEPPLKADINYFPDSDGHRNPPGSAASVPACAGLIAASEVIRDLISN